MKKYLFLISLSFLLQHANKISARSVLSFGSIVWHSGSPILTLYSIKYGLLSLIIRPPYNTPENEWFFRLSAFKVGFTILLIIFFSIFLLIFYS